MNEKYGAPPPLEKRYFYEKNLRNENIFTTK